MLEPLEFFGGESGGVGFKNAGVVAIEPVDFFLVQQGPVDQCLGDGNECECVEAEHVFAAIDEIRDVCLLDHHDIFDSDAEAAILVVSRFVGDEHAGDKGGA